MSTDPTPVNETPRDEMEIQRKDDLIVEFRKQLKANIRVVEQQQADQRIRQGALADALGVPRNDAPSSYYTNIEAVDILRKDLGQARRDLERVTQLYDASVKVLAAHVDAVRAAEVHCHLEHSPAQAGTEDTAQPGDEDNWRRGYDEDVTGQLQEIAAQIDLEASVSTRPGSLGRLELAAAHLRRIAGLLAARPDTQDDAGFLVGRQGNGDTEGERVEWNPAGCDWHPATVVERRSDTHLVIRLDDNRQDLLVETRHCRPATSERTGEAE